MIRGLRLLPWLQLAHDRNPDSVKYFFDCQLCMRERTTQSRQLLGCGYDPPAPEKLRPYVEPWDHHGRDRNPDEVVDGDPRRVSLPVCAGYVCSLPEVVETTWAHAFFDKGELAQFCDGQAKPMLLDALKVYAVERARCSSWESRNPEKK